MTDMNEEPSVSVKLSTIYEIVLGLQELPRIVSDGFKRTDNKDEEQDARLDNHGTRISEMEIRVTRIEAILAEHAKAELERKEAEREKMDAVKYENSRRPNLAAIGALIVSGVVALITFIKEIAN